MKGLPALLLAVAAAVALLLTSGTKGCAILGPVPGPRYIAIVHETALDTPELGALQVSLRKGVAYDYLKSKGHTLDVLDVNAKDQNGAPSVKVEKWKPYGPLPEMVIVAPPDKILSRQSLPLDSKPAVVIEAVKKQGG